MKPVAIILTALLTTALAAPADTTYAALAAREDAGLFGSGGLGKRAEAAKAEVSMQSVNAMEAMAADLARQSNKAISIPAIIKLIPVVIDAIKKATAKTTVKTTTKTPTRDLEARGLSAESMGMLESMQTELAEASEKGEQAVLDLLLKRLPAIFKKLGITQRDVSSEAGLSAKAMGMLQNIQTELAEAAEQGDQALAVPSIESLLKGLARALGNLHLKRDVSVQAGQAVEAVEMLQSIKAELAMAMAHQGQQGFWDDIKKAVNKVTEIAGKVGEIAKPVGDLIKAFGGKRDLSGQTMQSAQMLQSLATELAMAAEQQNQQGIFDTIAKIISLADKIIGTVKTALTKRDVSGQADTAMDAAEMARSMGAELSMAAEQSEQALFRTLLKLLPKLFNLTITTKPISTATTAVADKTKTKTVARDMSAEAVGAMEMLQSMKSELAMASEQGQEALLGKLGKLLPIFIGVLPKILGGLGGTPTKTTTTKTTPAKRESAEASVLKVGNTTIATKLVNILTNLLNSLLGTLQTNQSTAKLLSSLPGGSKDAASTLVSTLTGGKDATNNLLSTLTGTTKDATTAVTTTTKPATASLTDLLSKLGLGKLGGLSKREQAEVSGSMLDMVCSMVSEMAESNVQLNGAAAQLAQAVADIKAVAEQK